jgi:hypothetical protein
LPLEELGEQGTTIFDWLPVQTPTVKLEQADLREIQYHYFAVYRDLLRLSSNRDAVLMSSYVSSCLPQT